MFSNTSYSLATVDISVGPDLPTTFPDFLLDAGQLSPPAVALGSWDCEDLYHKASGISHRSIPHRRSAVKTYKS